MLEVSVIVNAVATLATVVVAFVLNKYFNNRVKLTLYCLHASVHKITKPEGIIHTHAIVIRNAGRVAAKNVRVGHCVFPEASVTVSPPTEYEKKEIEGGTELIFPILVPQEQLTISYLYFPPVTMGHINTYVKSDEGYAKVLNVIPAPKLPAWLEVVLYILLFIGGLFVMRIIVQLVALIIQNENFLCVFQ